MTKAPQQDPQPARLPQPPQPPAPGTPGSYTYTTEQVSGPQAVLRGARAQREELSGQLERLEDRREELAQELRESPEGPARQGLERRISEVDARISEVERQLAAADAAVARAAAIPGAVIEIPPPRPDPDAEAAEMAGMVGSVFIIFVLFPITIAYTRRLWRRSTAAVAELPKVLAERLARLDQAVDAIAIEVERISEGQRFLTKVMTEGGAGRALSTGPAQPVEIDAREAVRVPRSGSR